MNIDETIKNRKTQKVLANKAWEISEESKNTNQTIQELLELASYAPYHKKSHDSHTNRELNSCLPWRCYTLDATNCRSLLELIEKEDIKAGKVKNMLAAANALLLVTWLPEPGEQPIDPTNEALPFEGNLKNMEHIAASAAAIQNILLGATARNIPNYWSTGGQLRMEPLRTRLGISLEEVLLGAIFLFPSDSKQRGVTIKPGALRDQCKNIDAWSKKVDLSSL